MIAIDTNVLVRFLIADDPDQAARSKAIFDTQAVFVPTTVWLESEWLLRSAFNLPRSEIVDLFTAVAGLPQVKAEEPDKLIRALGWARSGLDFADAMHLAAAQDCEAMATFDRTFQRRGSALSPVPVREA